jgi:hypothetical protein
VPTPAVVAKLNNGLWQSSLAVLTQSAVNAFVLYVLCRNGSYNCVLEFVEHIVASTWRQHKFGESHDRFGLVLNKYAECRKDFKQSSKWNLFIYTIYSIFQKSGAWIT